MNTMTGQARLSTHEISFETTGDGDWRDLTSQVRDCIQHSEVANGIAVVFVPGSTGSVITVEAESGLLDDLRRLAGEMVEQHRLYEHEHRWHDGNAHSHLRASLFGASVCVPFANKELLLGAWQQIVFVDFDIRTRRRQVVLFCLGL